VGKTTQLPPPLTRAEKSGQIAGKMPQPPRLYYMIFSKKDVRLWGKIFREMDSIIS
jgi:phosphoribosylformylglycinamidine (FGAM) synthase-like amidotransferase family enzyme